MDMAFLKTVRDATEFPAVVAAAFLVRNAAVLTGLFALALFIFAAN
jgi:hypothetical protein